VSPSIAPASGAVSDKHGITYKSPFGNRSRSDPRRRAGAAALFLLALFQSRSAGSAPKSSAFTSRILYAMTYIRPSVLPKPATRWRALA
jgi:hypothetical protein